MIWEKYTIAYRRWLLGELPSGYLSLDATQKWLDEKRVQRPVRYRIFIALSSVHNRFRLIKKRFREKWIVKSHLLDTGLEPGHCYDYSERVMHALFNEFCKFVEVELAAEFARHYPDMRYDFFYFSQKRRPDLALFLLEDHVFIEYTDDLHSEHQILELYIWWTRERPSRHMYTQMLGKTLDERLMDLILSPGSIYKGNPLLL